MTARLAPAAAPYPPALQAAFDRLTRGRPLPALFATVANNPRAAERFMAGGLLDPGSVSLRQRELMILRITARCGAEYEWGLHVAAFGGASGWTVEQLHASVAVPTDPACWGAEERLILALADALHDPGDIDDALWEALSTAFSPAQLIELIMLAGQYHMVSFLCRGLRLPPEPGTPRFPVAAAGR